MPKTPTHPSTFPLFPNLPPELRTQIWRAALPHKINPALYPYQSDCWQPRHLSPSDEGHDSSNSELNLTFEFRHDLLDPVQISIPLVSVNREARSIALAWVRQQPISIGPSKDGRDPLSACPFDPTRDALYVALDTWDAFLREPGDRAYEPDLVGRLHDVGTEVRRVAVPAALLRSEGAYLHEMLLYIFRLRMLFVVVDAQPELRCVDDEGEVRRRWEFESVWGGAFVWDGERGGFDLEDGDGVGDGEVYRLIEGVSEGLGREVAKNELRGFEIRPVFIVKEMSGAC